MAHLQPSIDMAGLMWTVTVPLRAAQMGMPHWEKMSSARWAWVMVRW